MRLKTAWPVTCRKQKVTIGSIWFELQPRILNVHRRWQQLTVYGQHTKDESASIKLHVICTFLRFVLSCRRRDFLFVDEKPVSGTDKRTTLLYIDRLS